MRRLEDTEIEILVLHFVAAEVLGRRRLRDEQHEYAQRCGRDLSPHVSESRHVRQPPWDVLPPETASLLKGVTE